MVDIIVFGPRMLFFPFLFMLICMILCYPICLSLMQHILEPIETHVEEFPIANRPYKNLSGTLSYTGDHLYSPLLIYIIFYDMDVFV